MEKIDFTNLYEIAKEKLEEKMKDCFWGKKGLKQAINYIETLLSPIERKNGWQMAEAQGERTPYKIQQFLYRGAWEADELRNNLQDYVCGTLGEKEAVLVVDETGFLKKGAKSAGVTRQYSGTAGRIENSQVGVFLTYASSKGFTTIDRQLYLPKEWTDDAQRCIDAGIPEDITFKTKPNMALTMIKRVQEHKMPFSWVTGDSVYGDFSDIRNWLEKKHKNYVMAVSGKSYIWQGLKQHKVGTIIKNLPEDGWVRLSCGKGSKGERFYDWKAVAINQPQDENFQRLMLVRRSISSPDETRAFLCFSPKDTELQKLVEVAGIRWTVEQSFQETKSEVGLDQYEVRTYTGWYKHITLAMCAHALLATFKHDMLANQVDVITPIETVVGSLDDFKKGRNL